MALIVYGKENEIESPQDLRRWAIKNIELRSINSLDNEYYDTGNTGWEMLYDYLLSDSNGSGSFDDGESFLLTDEENLYKILRLEAHLFNMESNRSLLDRFYGYGLYLTAEEE